MTAKWLTRVWLAMLISLFVTTVALATSASATRANYVGSSDAVAYTSASDYDTSRWLGYLESKVVNPQFNISVVGYRSWTLREFCDLIITQSISVPADYNTNYWRYARSRLVTKEPCSGERTARSYTRHDFNHPGANGYCGGPSTAWCPDLVMPHQAVP